MRARLAPVVDQLVRHWPAALISALLVGVLVGNTAEPATDNLGQRVTIRQGFELACAEDEVALPMADPAPDDGLRWECRHVEEAWPAANGDTVVLYEP